MNHIDNIAENYLKFNYCNVKLPDLRQDLHYAIIKFSEWLNTADMYNRENIFTMSNSNMRRLFDDVKVRKLTFTLLPYDMLWSDYNTYEQYKRLLSASMIIQHETYNGFENTYYLKYFDIKQYNDEIPTYVEPKYSVIEKSLKDLWV